MDKRPVAGIDISKKFSDICVLSPTNEIIGKLHFTHDLDGLDKAVALLISIEEKYQEKPIVIMESTSHYHRLPYYYFYSKDFEVVVINPLQFNAIKNIAIRKVKTDELDAYRIALLYRLKEYKPTVAPVHTLFDIRNLSRQHVDFIQTRTMYVNHLTAELDQVFPHFKKIFPKLITHTVLALLRQYPSPGHILSANKKDIFEIILKMSRRVRPTLQQKQNCFLNMPHKIFSFVLKAKVICC